MKKHTILMAQVSHLSHSCFVSRIVQLIVGFLLVGISPLSLDATTYYVSTSGVDSYPGTFTYPFRKIQKAADIAQPGDTIVIRGGTYRETVTPVYSGTSSSPITYMSYQDEIVVISGTSLITNWTQHSGAIWKAAMTWTLGDDQVFVDGEMMTYARWPNASGDISRPYKSVMESVTANNLTPPSLTTATVYDSQLTQASGFWNGATIHFVPGPKWFQQTGTVTSSGAGSLTCQYLYQLNGGRLLPGNEYYLDGTLNALDAPGEWYRASFLTLYLWTPDGDSPSNHTVEAKSREYAFNLAGKSYITISNLQLFAASIFTDSSSANLVIDGIDARYVTHFSTMPNDAWGTHIKDSGIVLNGSNHQLLNSRIRYSAGSGVTLLGDGHLVQNNLIQDTNYAAIDNAAITTGNSAFNKNSQSSNHEIAYNTISGCGRSGMVLHGLENGYIHHNAINHYALQTIDCGGLYVYYWDGDDTEIAYNVINGGVVGIYLDNASENFVVHHNIVRNAETGTRLNTPSLNNEIYNNTFLARRSITTDAGAGMSGSVIKNNLLSGTVYLDDGVTYFSSANLCYWTDPLFVDALNFDFQLSAGSPAIDVGQVVTPYTNGFYGSLPDMGAHEYGIASGSFGASLPHDIPDVPSQLTVTDASGQAQLNWTDNSSSEDNYRIERSVGDDAHYQLLATVSANTTQYTDAGVVNDVRYFYRVSAYNTDGHSAYSNPVSFPQDWLPDDWSATDIGTVGIPGVHDSLSNPDADALLLKGAGTGIAGTSDGFYYVYTTLEGDGQIIAKLVNPSISQSGAVSGIMLRESLTAGSKHASLFIGPGKYPISLVRRTQTNGSTAVTSSYNVTVPYWIRLIRKGNSITAWKSPDRLTWTYLSSTTVSMASTMYVGLAITSGSTSVTSTGGFEEVTIAPLPYPAQETVTFSDDFDTNIGWANIASGAGKATIAPDPLLTSETAWYPSNDSDGSSVTSWYISSSTADISQGPVTMYVRVRFDRDDGGTANQFVYYLQETGSYRFGEFFIRPDSSQVISFFDTNQVIQNVYLERKYMPPFQAGVYQEFALCLESVDMTTMRLTAFVWDGNNYLPIGSAEGALYGSGLFNRVAIISSNQSGADNRAYLDYVLVTE